MTSKKYLKASTMFAAAFGLALGLMAAPVQAHCPHKGSLDHVHCDGGGTINYTAELTMGGFEFGPIDVIANSKENLLTPSPTEGPLLNLSISESDDPSTWDQVFNTCVELLAENSVEDFSVGIGQLRINKAGGVRVIFVDIRFDQGDTALLNPDVPAGVTVQLVGNEFDFTDPGKAFPPLPGDTSEFTLEQYIIWGETLKGIHPRMGCQPPGGGGADINDLLPNPEGFSTLTITAE